MSQMSPPSCPKAQASEPLRSCGLSQLGGLSIGGGMGKTLEERFWEKVEKGTPDECWPWTAGRAGGAYGSFRDGTRMVKAHRWSWEYHVGPIPDGLWVLHHCDNPPCVNPAHLWLGTHVDNQADKIAKGRQAKGSAQGFAKLTERDVAEILASRDKCTSLGAAYAVHPCQITRIRTREAWPHVSSDSALTYRDGRRGEQCIHAKLTEADVLAIRESTESNVALAARYGVADSGISRIRARKMWKHLN